MLDKLVERILSFLTFRSIIIICILGAFGYFIFNREEVIESLKKVRNPLQEETFTANVIINKEFKKTSLKIENSKCKNVDAYDKKFSCTELKEGKYNFVFYGDNEVFSGDFEKKNNDNTARLELREITVNKIQYALKNDILKGQIAFNLFSVSDENVKKIFRINNNDVRIDEKKDKDKNIINFSVKEWNNVVKPSEGIFLSIQIDDKFINNLPKVHYFDNNIISITNHETKTILLDTKTDNIDNFFIKFDINNLNNGNILTFEQDNKKILTISDLYYVNYTNYKVNDKYLCPTYDLCYMTSHISDNKNTSIKNFTITFERKKDTENTNRYTCYISSIQTNITKAKDLKESFDCSKNFNTIFYIKPENLKNNQKIVISNLITGKFSESDKSILRDMLKK